MLKEERQQKILSQLKEQGKILTLQMSQGMNVSEDTIRRDLKELADQGVIKKVHGGAILSSTNPFDFRERQVFALEEKKRLAQAMVSQLRSGQVIFMDGGTTNVEVARHIPADLSLTIFTNSLPVADVLAENPAIHTLILGGTLLPSARVTTGPEAIQQIRGIRADACILGTRSLHQEVGISEIDWDETLIKRAMVEASDSLYTLIIDSKLNTTQPYLICPPEKISGIFTTAPLQHPALQRFSKLGTDVHSV